MVRFVEVSPFNPGSLPARRKRAIESGVLRIGTAIAVCSTAVGISAFGQASAPAPADSSAKTPTYEVVSIKPHKSGAGSGSLRTVPDGIRWTNFPIASLIHGAYGIVMDSQVVGLPGWASSDPYDIEAKVDADTAEAWKKLSFKERFKREEPLLQSLLADRCRMKVRRETRILPVYDLVIARGGLKMKEAPPDEEGSQMGSAGKSGSKWTAHAQSTDNLALALSGEVGRIIVDKTGLAGKKFDFELTWTPDYQRSAAESADAGPSIFAALEEQLGLKLVSDKGPVDVVV